MLVESTRDIHARVSFQALDRENRTMKIVLTSPCGSLWPWKPSQSHLTAGLLTQFRNSLGWPGQMLIKQPSHRLCYLEQEYINVHFSKRCSVLWLDRSGIALGRLPTCLTVGLWADELCLTLEKGFTRTSSRPQTPQAQSYPRAIKYELLLVYSKKVPQGAVQLLDSPLIFNRPDSGLGLNVSAVVTAGLQQENVAMKCD